MFSGFLLGDLTSKLLNDFLKRIMEIGSELILKKNIDSFKIWLNNSYCSQMILIPSVEQ